MRPSYVLLLTTAVFLALGNALPTEAETARSLRSHQLVDANDNLEEERGGFTYKFDFNFWDDALRSLPEQFQTMRNFPENFKNVFASWKSGFVSLDEAATYMKDQGLSDKAIAQFKEAYNAYLHHK